MTTLSFELELHNETTFPDLPLFDEATNQLKQLAEDHSDIVGASVALEELTSADTPHVYQARVVLYIRPSNMAAVEKAPDAMQALKNALNAMERQVREHREKLKETWRQP